MGRLQELLDSKKTTTTRTMARAGSAGRRPRRRAESAEHVAPKTASTNPVERLTLGVGEAATSSGLSLRYLREEIRKGNLHTIRKGRRVLIPVASLKSYLGLN